MLLMLVKPHPSLEIFNQKCPVPENYKYAWEPVVLKLISHVLKQLDDTIETEIWHLTELEDDDKFLERVAELKPDIIAFSEIDVLVTQVNRLAKEVKVIDSNIITVVGGKQTSLLHKGDKFPYKHIDYAFRGDGPHSLFDLVQALKHGTSVEKIEGIILVNDDGYVYGEDTFSERIYHDRIDNLAMRNECVKNHSFEEYIEKYQKQPCILPGEIKTSPVYIGVGCPYNCAFCQSPIEYGHVGRVCLSPAQKVASEIAWLKKEYGVNNFFSLEPNLNVNNLSKIYDALEEYGIDYASVSGFIRAGDIKKFENVIKVLTKKGLRVVSIGLDIPLDTTEDIYNKSYSYNDMMECLNICEENGIIVLSTVFGDPSLTREQFRGQLEFVKKLKIAEVDVRLAIALRNTKYYQANKELLIHNPDTDDKYYDQQNYRYQTIQYPGKIVPEETYAELNDFYDTFYFDNNHIEYVRRMVKKYPDTKPYFQRLYSTKQNHTDYSKIKDIII